MAVSPEHLFLSQQFLKILEDFSNTGLYGYTESDRKRFDFTCVLKRDWSRPLIGQTLWKHSEGIDKDIRTMILDKESEIQIHVARDTIKNRATFSEIIQDYKSTVYRDNLFKLRTFWVPQDFDADNIQSQNVVKDILKNSIVDDILMNIIFGTLNTQDIRYFLNDTGYKGLTFAVLYEIAVNGFTNYTDLSKKIGISSNPLRERIIRLTGSGFLWNPRNVSMYYVSSKGRIFLQVIYKIFEEYRCSKEYSKELIFILEKLGMRPSNMILRDIIEQKGWNPELTFSKLFEDVKYACSRWDIELGNSEFKTNKLENSSDFRIYR